MPQRTQALRPQLLHRFPFSSLSVIMEPLFFQRKNAQVTHHLCNLCVFVVLRATLREISLAASHALICLILFRRIGLDLLCPSVSLRHLPALCNQLRRHIIFLHTPAPVFPQSRRLI